MYIPYFEGCDNLTIENYLSNDDYGYLKKRKISISEHNFKPKNDTIHKTRYKPEMISWDKWIVKDQSGNIKPLKRIDHSKGVKSKNVNSTK